MTKVDTLEKGEQFALDLFLFIVRSTDILGTFLLGPVAIALLDGNVPVRRNEPTQALKDRSERATQVAASRKDITRLFEEIGRLVGYTPQTAPRRELLLEAGTVSVLFYVPVSL